MSYDALEVLRMVEDPAMFGPDIKLDVKHNSKTHYLICVTRGDEILFSESWRWDLDAVQGMEREGTTNFMEAGREVCNRRLLASILAAGVSAKVGSVPSQDHEARIKDLERGRFLLDGCIEIGKEHERRIEELEEGNAILDKEHVKYMRRTEALEHFKNCYLLRIHSLEGSKDMMSKRIEGLEKALNEHMVKEREKAEVGVVATADVPLENFKPVIEDGDVIVTDGPQYRTTFVAMNVWSEGTIAPSSGRKRVTWYMDSRSGNNEYWVVEQIPER